MREAMTSGNAIPEQRRRTATAHCGSSDELELNERTLVGQPKAEQKARLEAWCSRGGEKKEEEGRQRLAAGTGTAGREGSKVARGQCEDWGSHWSSRTMEGSLLAPSINSSRESLPSMFLSIWRKILSVRFSGVDSSSGIFITDPTIL